MGIKSINVLLKKLCPEAFVKIRADYFKGEKVSIDGENVSIRFMASSTSVGVESSNIPYEPLDYDLCERVWFARWQNLVTKLLKREIVPVIIFDGTSPGEKLKTKQKRVDKIKKDREKYDNLVEEIKKLNPLEASNKIADLKKIASRLFYIKNHSKRKLLSYFESSGIPYAFARGEGERLCAMLVRDGHVATALSKDTDLMAYGTNISTTDILLSRDDVRFFECVLLTKVVEKLGLTYEQFLDLCIMCGCDYNSNVRGIGPHKSLLLLKKYGNVGQIKNIDTNCLNYNKCKELFSYVKSTELMVSNMERLTYKNLGEINPRTSPYDLDLKKTDNNSEFYFKSDKKYIITLPPVTTKINDCPEKWEYHIFDNRLSKASLMTLATKT